MTLVSSRNGLIRMKGFIKLHRQITEWEWYQDVNTKSVFIHLLLNACYDECRFMGQSVERGQYITSLSRLSRDLSISVRQVRTALSRLEKTGEIDTQTTNKSTLITICNYGSYQIDESKVKKKATRKRQAVDKQTTDINKIERKEEGNNNTYYEKVRKEEIWVSQVGMQYHTTKSTILNALEKFTNHLNITQDEKRTTRDFKSHFVNWLKYNLDESGSGIDTYRWKWKGQAMKTGSKEEYERDKAAFDKDGFDFQTLH